MSAPDVRVSREWLALREPADAAARAVDLVEALGRRMPPAGQWVIHDLGGGTGSMGRWLAPRLPGRQHWVVHDRDADLLEIAPAVPRRSRTEASTFSRFRRRCPHWRRRFRMLALHPVSFVGRGAIEFLSAFRRVACPKAAARRDKKALRMRGVVSFVNAGG